MRKGVLLILAVFMLTGANALAQSPLSAIRAADSAYRDGQFVDAIRQLQTAIEAVWNEAPLSVNNLHFITNEPQGFGDFQPRADNVFDSIEPVRLYCEIIGPVAKKTGHVYHTAISYDFRVIGSSGQVLGGQKGLKALESESSFFSTDIMMYLTLNFKGLESGNFTLEMTLHDKNSSKTNTFNLPFVIK